MNTLRTYICLLLLAAGVAATPAMAQDDGCTADPWDGATIYYRGDQVSHDYQHWKA